MDDLRQVTSLKRNTEIKASYSTEFLKAYKEFWESLPRRPIEIEVYLEDRPATKVLEEILEEEISEEEISEEEISEGEGTAPPKVPERLYA